MTNSLTPDEGPSLETSIFPLSFQVVRESLPFAYQSNTTGIRAVQFQKFHLGSGFGPLVVKNLGSVPVSVIFKTKPPISKARPHFGENVRGGGKFFRGGATMFSPSRQRAKIKKYLTYI